MPSFACLSDGQNVAASTWGCPNTPATAVFGWRAFSMICGLYACFARFFEILAPVAGLQPPGH